MFLRAIYEEQIAPQLSNVHEQFQEPLKVREAAAKAFAPAGTPKYSATLLRAEIFEAYDEEHEQESWQRGRASPGVVCNINYRSWAGVRCTLRSYSTPDSQDPALLSSWDDACSQLVLMPGQVLIYNAEKYYCSLSGDPKRHRGRKCGVASFFTLSSDLTQQERICRPRDTDEADGASGSEERKVRRIL
jgi:hypothetical protein